jgi:hypothetical protein
LIISVKIFTVATRVAADVSVVSTAATTSPATASYVASALKIATAPTVSSARAMRSCFGDESAFTIVSGPLDRHLLRHGRLHQVPVLVEFCRESRHMYVLLLFLGRWSESGPRRLPVALLGPLPKLPISGPPRSSGGEPPLVRVGPGLIVGRGSVPLATGVAFGPRLLVVGVVFYDSSKITSNYFDFKLCFQLRTSFDGKA